MHAIKNQPHGVAYKGSTPFILLSIFEHKYKCLHIYLTNTALYIRQHSENLIAHELYLNLTNKSAIHKTQENVLREDPVSRGPSSAHPLSPAPCFRNLPRQDNGSLWHSAFLA